MIYAPVALFVYNRLDHTRRTIEALNKNDLSEKSDLLIFSDAPKSEAQVNSVREVRQYISGAIGFNSVAVVERASNFGLAKSIIDGVTTVLNKYESIIVLEDDMVTSPYFLSYMNAALDKYLDDSRVISIHGYVYPVDQLLPEAFFLRGADCWGWATWRRGWSQFNPDGQYLLDELKRLKLIRDLDFNGAYSFSQMLEAQIKGINDSWAVRWHASAFLANKLTLYPGRSLVQNIGNDNSGTHCGDSALHDIELSRTPIDLNNLEIKPSEEGHSAFEKFFQKSRGGFWRRLARRISMNEKAAK